MPTKERYWKNPEHHRAEYRNRCRRRVAQGIPWRYQLSPEAGERRRLAQQKLSPKRRLAINAGARRMRARMKKLFGTSGRTGYWLYHLRTEEKKLAKRKSRAAALLSRELVESRRGRPVVSGRKA